MSQQLPNYTSEQRQSFNQKPFSTSPSQNQYASAPHHLSPSYRYPQPSQQQQYDSQANLTYTLIKFEPQHGPEGTDVSVMLKTSCVDKHLKLAFGSLIVETRQFDHNDYTSLNATVPSFSLTNSDTSKVSVKLYIFNEEDIIGCFQLGEFTYEAGQIKSERKRSAESTCAYEPDFYGASAGGNSKKMNTDTVRPKEEDNYNILGNNYQSYYQPPMLASSYALHQRGFFGDVYNYQSSANPQYLYASTAPTTTVSIPAISGLGLSIPELTPSTVVASPSHLASIPVASFPHITTGVDTAPIIAPANDSSPVLPSTSYAPHPYATLVNKANLRIQGNVEEMASHWTQDECDNRRRLVQFWRRQEGNDIVCTFAPVAASERQPNSIVVSCIYWQEKNECYITSVDTIMLLESLIGVRFTVEEKNRIRRNLEGFRPTTVSKCKPESAEFFKLIMSFPNPKPRNIEKDVKVFQWSNLMGALRKIISKYTASYSSTASVNVEAIQSATFPSNMSSTSLASPSESYGSAAEASSPVESNILPTSGHVVASQGHRSDNISSQHRNARLYSQHSAFDTLSPYTSHSHIHHTPNQYSYGHRHFSPYAAANTDQVGYDDDAFHSGTSHGGSPHTLSPWGTDD